MLALVLALELVLALVLALELVLVFVFGLVEKSETFARFINLSFIIILSKKKDNKKRRDKYGNDNQKIHLLTSGTIRKHC